MYLYVVHFDRSKWQYVKMVKILIRPLFVVPVQRSFGMNCSIRLLETKN